MALSARDRFVLKLAVACLGIILVVWLLFSHAHEEVVVASSRSGATKPPLPKAGGEPGKDFWDSFGKVEVFVLTVPQTINRWRHLRDVISTGPWKANLIEGCTTETPEVASALKDLRAIPDRAKNLQEKPVALVCSHYRAVEAAKKKNLDYALILEDDAQFINDFWRKLELRLRQLPSFGVFYLQHSCSENILRLDRSNVHVHKRNPIWRKFVPHEVFGIGGGAFDGQLGTIWDAGGYLLSKPGIDVIMEHDLGYWLRHARGSFKIYSSEMVLSYVADAHGAYFSIPPLIYQCTSKSSLIQNSGKAYVDKLGRQRQKELYNAILAQGKQEQMPEWLLECGFSDCPTKK